MLRPGPWVIAVLIFLVFGVLASCDISLSPHCRGDSTPARDPVSLVSCKTLDSLAFRPADTTRPK